MTENNQQQFDEFKDFDFDERQAIRIFDLTFQEVQISKYLALGESRAEISNRFEITEETVKTHAKHIYKKVGDKIGEHVNSSNLITFFHQHKIITLTEKYD